MGIGGIVFYEQLAATTALSVSVPISYHFNIGGGKLSIGVSPGLYSQGRDASKYRANDPNDPYVPASVNDLQFDLGAGIYYKSQHLFAGLSSTHITEPKFSFKGQAGAISSVGESGMLRHYYGVVGYNFEVSPTITLTPSALYKTTFKTDGSQLEGGLMATFNNKFWVGLNYADAEAGSAIVGLSLMRDNSLRFSYALDLITAGKEAKAATSHELMLSYTLPVALKGPKPAVRTPRYRK
jgi:type IX secretion system PorP/SprF family membrane protein